MSWGVLSSWREADPPGWTYLATTDMGTVEQLGGTVRLNGKQRHRKVWLNPESLVAGSTQQEEILEGSRKASGINDDEGIAKESVACLNNHLT